MCSNYNVLKIIVALAQTLYAVTTLYDTQGDQLERFGYAAFGLTVTPYLFMSTLNLMGNLIRPDYPAMYLVRSRDMDELARTCPQSIDGTVGSLTATYEQSLIEKIVLNHELGGYHQQPQGGGQGAGGSLHGVSRSAQENHQELHHGVFRLASLSFALMATCGFILSFIPIAVIGGMTRFRPGHSTHAQRSWIMSWIVFGAYLGWWQGYVSSTSHVAGLGLFQLIYLGLICALYSAPALGGMIVVGQEISSYGVCKRI